MKNMKDKMNRTKGRDQQENNGQRTKSTILFINKCQETQFNTCTRIYIITSHDMVNVYSNMIIVNHLTLNQKWLAFATSTEPGQLALPDFILLADQLQVFILISPKINVN